MSLALVPRGVRALADQLNATYRVLKGTDPDSVYLRLLPSGSFEVRHSSTNAAVFKVTDTGITGTYIPGDITNPDIADGAVTSAKIQDGAIMDGDVNAAANINASKLLDGSVTLAKLAPSSVDTSKIADGTIVNADVNAAAALAVSKLGAGGTANRVVATIDGAVVAMQQVVDAMVSATANLAVSKLAPGSANQGLYTAGGVAAWGASTKSVLSGVGDLVYASAANTLARLPIGTANQVLGTNPGATAPQWMASLQSLMTATGDLVYGASANTPARLAVGTNAQVLTISGGLPSWQPAGGVTNGSITSLQIADNTIQTIDIATGGQIAKLQTSYAKADDNIFGAASPGTIPTSFAGALGPISFNVDDANSIVAITTRGMILCSFTTTVEVVAALYIDGTWRGHIGLACSNVNNQFPLVLNATIYLTGLSAGTHSLVISLKASASSVSAYWRSASQPDYESCQIQWEELKR